MDEAERCHRLGYIAYGRLLATGTPAELVRNSPLHTWRVTGSANAVNHIASALENTKGVDMVTRFGNNLHVSSVDAEALLAAVSPYHADTSLKWHNGAPTLEDVFIHLMQQSADNFAH